MMLLAKAAVGAVIAVSLTACNFQTTRLVTAHPNPPPPAGYVVECATYQLPLVYSAIADCRPGIRGGRQATVRAKG